MCTVHSDHSLQWPCGVYELRRCTVKLLALLHAIWMVKAPVSCIYSIQRAKAQICMHIWQCAQSLCCPRAFCWPSAFHRRNIDDTPNWIVVWSVPENPESSFSGDTAYILILTDIIPKMKLVLALADLIDIEGQDLWQLLLRTCSRLVPIKATSDRNEPSDFSDSKYLNQPVGKSGERLCS